ncbi:hypothetical protein C8J57DRAFT_1247716 [Mycena rebaudengoi]|nr:hypothetical protein C8J57DRAFT_1247716 [Mycena rebaudengoi]
MDKFYDLKAAATHIFSRQTGRNIQGRRAALAARASPVIQHLSDIDVEMLQVAEAGAQKKNWRLCVAEIEPGVLDEVVLRIQGVLTKNNLVPKNVNSIPQRKRQFLGQHAEICGVNTGTFDACIRNMANINEKFEQHLCSLTAASTAETTGLFGKLFSASNRLFTLRSEAPTEQDTDFQLGVDPLGLLNRLKTADMIHSPENMVKYYKMCETANGKISYEETVPGVFKAGDIVEMQVSFVAILNAQKAVKRATEDRAFAELNKSVKGSAIRRKVGYFYEDEEDNRQAKRSKGGEANDASESCNKIWRDRGRDDEDMEAQPHEVIRRV